MRKQFDLNYYLEHPETKVVTRKGHNVRIICTDAKVENPVIALVTITEIEEEEEVVCYYCDGSFREDIEDDFDLFFELPDPENKKVPLTYEDMLQRVKDGKTMWVLFDDGSNFLILAFNKEGVAIADGENYYRETGLFEYETLEIAKAHFADGTPCWKEVDGE